MSEIEDIQSRKCNLILHNLPESDTEQDDIQGGYSPLGEEFHIRTKIVSATMLGRMWPTISEFSRYSAQQLQRKNRSWLRSMSLETAHMRYTAKYTFALT